MKAKHCANTAKGDIMKVRGLILAGGTGSRLWPITGFLNKHLLPVHDKPMIYYPLTNLMLAGINEIGIVSSQQHLDWMRQCLGSGEKFGIEITYIQQDQPRGIVDAIKSAKNFLSGYRSAIQLGDNFFFGTGLTTNLLEAINSSEPASIFTYRVANPGAFGILEIKQGRIQSIEEKPKMPKDNLAITGLYIFDETLEVEATKVESSDRGELEVTDLLRFYAESGGLNNRTLPRGSAWLDLGTLEDLGRASTFVETIQLRQGLLVGSPEEAASRNGWISDKDLKASLSDKANSDYASSVTRIISGL